MEGNQLTPDESLALFERFWEEEVGTHTNIRYRDRFNVAKVLIGGKRFITILQHSSAVSKTGDYNFASTASS